MKGFWEGISVRDREGISGGSEERGKGAVGWGRSEGPGGSLGDPDQGWRWLRGHPGPFGAPRAFGPCGGRSRRECRDLKEGRCCRVLEWKQPRGREVVWGAHLREGS